MQSFVAICMHAQTVTHSIDNVLSQEQLAAGGPCFVAQSWFSVAMKNGVSWEKGFAIGDAGTKIVPKMPYFSVP